MSELTLSPLMYEQVCKLLQHTFGSQVELATYKIANRRQDYLVLLADLVSPDLRVSIKLAGPRALQVQPFDRVAMLHQLVRAHTTIPVPEIIAVNTSYKDWPWRYLIKTCIAGHEWASVRPQLSPHEVQKAHMYLGQAVAQLHLIQFPLFGEFMVDGEVQGGVELAVAVRHRAEFSIQSPRLRQLFLEVLEKHAMLFRHIKPACFCHEDLHGHNILVHYQHGQWRIATILDFDKAWAGHHETDLARLDLWTGMTGHSFWEAYGSIVPVADSYLQRRPIYQLLWCFEYAASTSQHLADTQQVCNQLGISPIEQFE